MCRLPQFQVCFEKEHLFLLGCFQQKSDIPEPTYGCHPIGSAFARCTDDPNHIFRLRNLIGTGSGRGEVLGGGGNTYKSAQALGEIDCELQ